jgi:hypothetical protein
VEDLPQGLAALGGATEKRTERRIGDSTPDLAFNTLSEVSTCALIYSVRQCAIGFSHSLGAGGNRTYRASSYSPSNPSVSQNRLAALPGSALRTESAQPAAFVAFHPATHRRNRCISSSCS